MWSIWVRPFWFTANPAFDECRMLRIVVSSELVLPTEAFWVFIALLTEYATGIWIEP